METSLESPPDPGGEAVPVSRRAPGSGVVGALFAVLVVVTVLVYVAKTRGYAFSTDDWLFAQRGHSFVDYFRPYNLSLAAVPIAVYRALFAAFGFRTTLPLRLVGIACELSVAVALFLTVRSRLSAAVALVVGASFLWYPNMVLYPSAFDHYIGLTAAVGCAWILTRRRPDQDLLLAGALSFALCASGVGVAAGAGGLVYLAIGGAPWRRWLAVAAPMAAWTIWWASVAHAPRDAARRTPAQGRDLVVNGIIRSFDGLVGNHRVLGGLLMAAFAVALVAAVVSGARSARGGLLRSALGGLRAADHQLAWSVALVVWWVGLAYSRGQFAFPGVFRYQFVGSGLVVLGFLPSTTPGWAGRWLRGWSVMAAAVALSLLVGLANRSGITHKADLMNAESDHLRSNMIQANLGPRVVPDSAPVPLGPGGVPTLSAGLYRHLVAELGVPRGTRPGDPDAAILALLGTHLEARTADPAARCIPLPPTLSLAPGATTHLRAGSRPVEVRLRRLDRGWTRVGAIAPHQDVQLELPAGPAPAPWILSAPGACRIVPPSA